MQAGREKGGGGGGRSDRRCGWCAMPTNERTGLLEGVIAANKVGELSGARVQVIRQGIVLAGEASPVEELVFRVVRRDLEGVLATQPGQGAVFRKAARGVARQPPAERGDAKGRWRLVPSSSPSVPFLPILQVTRVVLRGCAGVGFAPVYRPQTARRGMEGGLGLGPQVIGRRRISRTAGCWCKLMRGGVESVSKVGAVT